MGASGAAHRVENESLQVLISPSDTAVSSPVSASSSAVGLDVLLSQSPPASAAKETDASAKEVDVRSTKEYLEQANELMLSNERCISLNVGTGTRSEA